MKRSFKKKLPILSGPLLDKVKVQFPPSLDATAYPFSLSIIKNLSDITFPTQVTFFVGENGTGKSTLLEAIAHNAGFGAIASSILRSKHLRKMYTLHLKSFLIA